MRNILALVGSQYSSDSHKTSSTENECCNLPNLCVCRKSTGWKTCSWIVVTGKGSRMLAVVEFRSMPASCLLVDLIWQNKVLER